MNRNLFPCLSPLEIKRSNLLSPRNTRSDFSLMFIFTLVLVPQSCGNFSRGETLVQMSGLKVSCFLSRLLFPEIRIGQPGPKRAICSALSPCAVPHLAVATHSFMSCDSDILASVFLTRRAVRREAGLWAQHSVMSFPICLKHSSLVHRLGKDGRSRLMQTTSLMSSYDGSVGTNS